MESLRRKIKSRLSFDTQQLIAEYWMRLKMFDLSKLKENETLFIHVPKCAGSSVKEAFPGGLGYVDGHVSALAYKNYLGATEYDKKLSFAVLRNPWDRAVSAYSYLQDNANSKSVINDAFYHKTLSRYGSFKEFVMEWLAKQEKISHNHFVPQHKFLCDENGNLIVKELMDLKNLHQGLGNIAQSLNLEINLKQINTSPRKASYQEYYDDETKEAIRSVYAKDISLFNYKF